LCKKFMRRQYATDIARMKRIRGDALVKEAL
jgi:hypothetical protein